MRLKFLLNSFKGLALRLALEYAIKVKQCREQSKMRKGIRALGDHMFGIVSSEGTNRRRSAAAAYLMERYPGAKEHGPEIALSTTGTTYADHEETKLLCSAIDTRKRYREGDGPGTEAGKQVSELGR